MFVTGVQTCAVPISFAHTPETEPPPERERERGRRERREREEDIHVCYLGWVPVKSALCGVLVVCSARL